MSPRKLGFALLAAAAMVGLVQHDLLPVDLFGASGPAEVAMVYESSQGLPAAFVSGDVRDLLKSSAITYRRLDKDVPFSDSETEKHMHPFIEHAGDALPAIVVKRGSKYYTQHVDPSDSATVVAFLRKHGAK